MGQHENARKYTSNNCMEQSEPTCRHQARVCKQRWSPERLLLLTSRPRSAGSADAHAAGSVPVMLHSPAMRSCRLLVLLGWDPQAAGKGPPKWRVPLTSNCFSAGKLPFAPHSPGRLPCGATRKGHQLEIMSSRPATDQRLKFLLVS